MATCLNTNGGTWVDPGRSSGAECNPQANDFSRPHTKRTVVRNFTADQLRKAALLLLTSDAAIRALGAHRYREVRYASQPQCIRCVPSLSGGSCTHSGLAATLSHNRGAIRGVSRCSRRLGARSPPPSPTCENRPIGFDSRLVHHLTNSNETTQRSRPSRLHVVREGRCTRAIIFPDSLPLGSCRFARTCPSRNRRRKFSDGCTSFFAVDAGYNAE